MATPTGADRFLIAPFESGLVKNMEPWLTPEDSFEQLNNAYVFRGKVKKRFGSKYTGSGGSEGFEQLKSRLRIQVDTTDGSGNCNTSPIPGAIFKVGQLYSIADEIFTVVDVSAGAQDLLTTGSATVATFNITTKTLIINGAGATKAVYFYPSEPVMGFAMHEKGTINDHTAYAYDTQFAYKFASTYWVRAGAQTYTGDNTQYFWTTNWDGLTPETTAMFSTNFHEDDYMRYTLEGTTWTEFKPQYNVNGTATLYNIKTARIILPFKNRLILLNTVETKANATTYTSYTNRCRYSHNGSPLGTFPTSAWYESGEVGYTGAGYLDAPTEESIIAAEFIKDRLIVYFERSTWELAYTANEVLPFVWQKLNTELGSESTFSSVPFDKHILNVGANGIHACNGLNVERIDSKIPDELFKDLNISAAIVRVHGIRDYYSELVYWTLPRSQPDDTNNFADKVLVYNYKNDTWSLNDDAITSMGYMEQTISDVWEGDYQTWEDDDKTWNSGLQLANHREVIAGNQQGFVFSIDDSSNSNASVLQVTAVSGDTLTIKNHNLMTGQYLKLSNMNGLTAGADGIYQITKATGASADDEVVLDVAPTGTYKGGGTAARVSQISIVSKEWNPYIDKGISFYLNKIDFCVSKTTNGEITVNYYPASTDLDLVEAGELSDSNLSTYILETRPYVDSDGNPFYPLETLQNRLWHSLYFQAYGFGVKIRINFSHEQLIDTSIAESAFELQGMVLETRPGGVI